MCFGKVAEGWAPELFTECLILLPWQRQKQDPEELARYPEERVVPRQVARLFSEGMQPGDAGVRRWEGGDREENYVGEQDLYYLRA